MRYKYRIYRYHARAVCGMRYFRFSSALLMYAYLNLNLTTSHTPPSQLTLYLDAMERAGAPLQSLSSRLGPPADAEGGPPVATGRPEAPYAEPLSRARGEEPQGRWEE